MSTSPSNPTTTIEVSSHELGVILDALDIRAAQWGEMAIGHDPCPERFETNEGEARELSAMYRKVHDKLTAEYIF